MGLRIIPSNTFRNTEVGCLGGVLLVVLTAGGALGLVGMVWWMVTRNATGGP